LAKVSHVFFAEGSFVGRKHIPCMEYACGLRIYVQYIILGFWANYLGVHSISLETDGGLMKATFGRIIVDFQLCLVFV